MATGDNDSAPPAPGAVPSDLAAIPTDMRAEAARVADGMARFAAAAARDLPADVEPSGFERLFDRLAPDA